MYWTGATVWWIAAGLLVVAELASGTFYLLMLALGAGAGALAAHFALGPIGCVPRPWAARPWWPGIFDVTEPPGQRRPRATQTSTSTSARACRSTIGLKTASLRCSTEAPGGRPALSAMPRPKRACT